MIGCGEGLQTEYLALLAQQIVGLDPSSRAIKKAKSGQIANATFMVGDLMKYEPHPKTTFDLVTACEVLYYIEDLDQAYHKLNSLGQNCVVTFYQGAFERLDRYFAKKPVTSETIDSSYCKWRVVYWGPRCQQSSFKL